MIVTAIDAREPDRRRGERDRQHPGDDRDGRHQDRAQPDVIGLNQGLMALDPLLAERVRVVHLEDRVLLDDAEEHHQPDRAVDVDRHPERHQRSRPAGRLSGSAVMIVSGWTKLLNCDASTM